MIISQPRRGEFSTFLAKTYPFRAPLKIRIHTSGIAIRFLKNWPRFALAVIIPITGCHRARIGIHPTTAAILQYAADGLTPPVTDELLKATVVPPVGWTPDPVKQTEKHRHEVWLSPTRQTAYGVIYFDLPLPVGVDLALWGFLKEMKSTEGEANLIFKKTDQSLPGIRFAAEGGLYTVRCKLQVDGFHGWIVYAGTLRSKPINNEELKSAELARDHTRVDLP
jgi:hypothetical protein